MHMDALTLAALAGELSETLRGARIDDVIQPTPLSVALQCWGGGRNRWLLASAHPQLARVHLVAEKPRKLTAEPPAFVMLLRKHLEGTRIVALRQPGWERVLEIGFARGPLSDVAAPAYWLTIEIMGRLSNVILRDHANNIILGALHLVPATVNRYRTIAPHVPYRYPPPQTRLLAGESVPRLAGETVTAEELHMAAESVLSAPVPETGRKRAREAPTLAAMLAAQVEGFSRELGREVAARAAGGADAPLTRALPWDAVAVAVHELAALPETRDWRPTLVYADDESGAPLAYAVYEPRQYAGKAPRAAPSVDDMLATYYKGAEWHTSVEGAKGDLRHLLQTLRDRAVRKNEALREELRALDEAHHLREEADILLAFQGAVPPNAPSVTLLNPFSESEGAEQVTITLDPALSAVENANRRYARYHKMRRATERIPAQIAANELALARIEQLRTDLALAETPAEIAHVRAEVVEAGYLRGRPEKPTKAARNGKTSKTSKKGSQSASTRKAEGGAPLRLESTDGLTLLVGKNSLQNEEVTFHLASPNDVWLHARGVPGAHVIVKSGGRPVPESTLREAAALAAYYSQAREQGTAPVDHTEVRYVRHMRGGGPGMVIYEREKTLYVGPRQLAHEPAHEPAQG